MNISLLSNKYNVKRIETPDIEIVYELCCNNSLYYQYCPPFVSTQSIKDDMSALPPNKTLKDKYYVGYYEENKLIAVMDLIMGYPEESVAFIGFFMTDIYVQNKGIGSSIIEELCAALSQFGVSSIRLGWVRGNPQAEYFWHKNGFTETGATYETDNYTLVIAQRSL